MEIFESKEPQKGMSDLILPNQFATNTDEIDFELNGQHNEKLVNNELAPALPNGPDIEQNEFYFSK